MVRFRFYKPETKKSNRTQTEKNWKKPRAEPDKNRSKLEKPSQKQKTEPNRKNRAKTKTEPNRKNRANWFEQVFVKKTRTEPKPVCLNPFRLFFSKIFFDLVIFF